MSDAIEPTAAHDRGHADVTALGEPTGGAPQRVAVAVDNGHCHQYAICQQEAPGVFELRTNERLHYQAFPAAQHTEQVRQAARLCPMQAISVVQR